MSPFRLGWHYPNGDPSIQMFDRAVRAWELDIPVGGRVLELGCCETDFSVWLHAADPTLQLTGVDVNDCPGFQGTFVKSPAEACTFADNSFEAVILLGSLEHFGLGFYGDPVRPVADVETIFKVHDWLVPGGWVYYDVPWTPLTHYITENRHFRVYDDATLPGCEGLRPVRRAYAHGNDARVQAIRPQSPASPFWYVARLLEKAS